MYDDIRNKLVHAFRTAHVTSYPSVPYNIPNRETYDPETDTSPFVVFSYDITPTQLGISQPSSGKKAYRVKGNLRIIYFYRPNTGISGSTKYADFLAGAFGLKVVNGITFEAVRPYPDAGMSGWEGTMFVIPFQVEYFNVT